MSIKKKKEPQFVTGSVHGEKTLKIMAYGDTIRT